MGRQRLVARNWVCESDLVLLGRRDPLLRLFRLEGICSAHSTESQLHPLNFSSQTGQVARLQLLHLDLWKLRRRGLCLADSGSFVTRSEEGWDGRRDFVVLLVVRFLCVVQEW